jgi:hypothetical protein
MIALLAALLLNPNPVILNFDAPTAEGWEQTVVYRCGTTTLRVTGYGASKPFAGVAAITVNGALLEGDAADALRRDLSNRRAVYRLGARCPREPDSISLIINRGERTEAGGVAYWSASALITGHRVMFYTGLRQSTDDAFWF